MKRLLFLLSLLLGFCDNTPAVAENRHHPLASLPEPGRWRVSAGGTYLHLDARLTTQTIDNQHAGAGFLSVEHAFTRSLSVELALHGTPYLDTTILDRNLLTSGDRLRLEGDYAAFFPTLGLKTYPLRWRQGRFAHFPAQPYLLGGLGLLLMPLDFTGSYDTGEGDRAEVRAQFTPACGLWFAGGGLEYSLGRRLGLFLDGGYLRTFAEPELSVSAGDLFATRLPVEAKAFSARFGLKWSF